MTERDEILFLRRKLMAAEHTIRTERFNGRVASAGVLLFLAWWAWRVLS